LGSWGQRAAAISRFCYLQWLPRGKEEAASRNHSVTQLPPPSFIPRGGDNWMWWEPGGATRVTHWDPISITCRSPGAVVYYRVNVGYDEAWEEVRTRS